MITSEDKYSEVLKTILQYRVIAKITNSDYYWDAMYNLIDEVNGYLKTKDQYLCANCLMVFDRTWTDAEAKKEFEDRFSGESFEHVTKVCDPCYIDFMKWHEKKFLQ